MAPRKEKAKKVSGDAANDIVLDYLRKQNRPYSALDISANLKNKVSKTAAAKLLKELHEAKQIEGRASGKQWVYHTIQSPADLENTSGLISLDAQIETLQEQIIAANTTAKTLRASLAALSSTLSTAQLREAIDGLSTEKDEITARLVELRSGQVKAVTVEEKTRLEAEAKKWSGIATRRKGIVRVMWGLIEDGIQGDEERAELKEQLGLD